MIMDPQSPLPALAWDFLGGFDQPIEVANVDEETKPSSKMGANMTSSKASRSICEPPTPGFSGLRIGSRTAGPTDAVLAERTAVELDNLVVLHEAIADSARRAGSDTTS